MPPMTLREQVAEMVRESADEHGVIEPNAEQLGNAVLSVLDFADSLDAEAECTDAAGVGRFLAQEIRDRVRKGLEG